MTWQARFSGACKRGLREGAESPDLEGCAHESPDARRPPAHRPAAHLERALSARPLTLAGCVQQP